MAQTRNKKLLDTRFDERIGVSDSTGEEFSPMMPADDLTMRAAAEAARDDVIREALRDVRLKAEERRDRRLNLLITKSMSDQIDEASKEIGCSKNEFIIRAVNLMLSLRSKK